MLNELHQELTVLAEKLARRDKLAVMLESLRAEEQSLSAREAALRALLNQENADVERLERTSAAALFYTLLGQKEAKLEKEQREACAAKLQYDAVVRQLDDCRVRTASLQAELVSLRDAQRQYQAVFHQIQAALKADPNYAEAVCSLEKSLGEEQALLKELREAVSAAEACLDQTDVLTKSLDSAEGWGTWDVLGGGMLADMAKHTHLDEAQAEAEQLQLLLGRFRTELADVRVAAPLGQVNVDGFLRFADYFFDGLIADWSVLSRIHDSQTRVKQVAQQLSTALSRLRVLQKTHETEKTRLDRALTALVERAQ